MAKKIKTRTMTREEREAEKQREAEERARDEAGIQDEFQAKGFELVEWTQDNRQVIVGVLAAIVISGALVGVWTLLGSSQNAEASRAYSQALDVWEAGIGEPLPGLDDGKKLRFDSEKERSEQALEKFEALVEEYTGTGAGALGHLYAGHAAMDLSQWDKAIEHYGKYLSRQGRSDELRFAALEGRAAAYEAKGEHDKALEDYQSLIDASFSPSKDAALYSAARLLIEKGDKEGAKRHLDRLSSEFPTSPVAPNADALRARAALGDAPKAAEGTKGAG